MQRNNKLWIVIPCYNEELMLPLIAPNLHKILISMVESNACSDDSLIVFVDDGSSDNTWDVIQSYSEMYRNIEGIKLDHNRGQTNAIMAGLMTAKDADVGVTITLDCDGQDDYTRIPYMMEEYIDGADIVYGVRNNRDTDSWFKRTTALSYYKIMGLFDKSFIYNHAEFRLMSRTVLGYLDCVGETSPFIRKICGVLTHKENILSKYIYYKRNEREAGESKYTLKVMIKFAMRGMRRIHIEPKPVSHKDQFVIETTTNKNFKIL